MKRLEWPRENLPFEDVRKARIYLHHAVFSLRLANRKMNRRGYRDLINREMKKGRPKACLDNVQPQNFGGVPTYKPGYQGKCREPCF